MSRSLSVWLLASALAVFVGCGGGAETDSGAVASNSEDAMPASGEGSEMEPDGGTSSSSGDDEMNEEMYSSDDSSDESADQYDAEMEAYAAESDPGDESSTEDVDMAEMEAAYAAAEEMEAAASDGEVSSDPDGEYSDGSEGAGTVAEKVPDGFDGKAQLAFRRGKEKDAMQFLYAHALTTDAGAESLLPTIRWVGGLREPKLAVRWGAGFIVTAPRNFNGDPKPVGSQQNIPTRGAGGNDAYVGGGGGDDYGGGASAGGQGASNSLLAKGAGELGEKLVAAYKERVLRGDFGEVLKNATESSRGANRNAGGDGMSGYGASDAMESGEGGGAAAALTQVTQIVPGLSMLGIGTQKELIDRAREDGIDAVVIIDVKLRVNTSNGLVTNESTLALLDAKTQKKLHTTKKFNNITIQMARADEKEDGVDKELENLFEAIDANFKMTDLPAGLNAEVAANRVAALAADKHDNPLPILAEAKMYHTKGLMEESALFASYEKVLGVDRGRLLATGEEEDKKKALDEWLPES